MRIRVACYSGYRGEETPRRIVIGDRHLEVVDIIDRWLAPQHRYIVLCGPSITISCIFWGNEFLFGNSDSYINYSSCIDFRVHLPRQENRRPNIISNGCRIARSNVFKGRNDGHHLV